MIKLLDILKESLLDGNVYEINFQKGKYKIEKTTLSKIESINNLVYDFGGGAYWYEDPSPNIVIVDILDVNDIAKMPEGEGEDLGNLIKYYIKHDLNIPINLPKAKKINISKLTHYLKNIDGFAETVNSSLSPKGQIDYYTDTMNKKDKQFIHTMVEKYNFKLPTNADINNLSQNKGDYITLQKDIPYNPPQEIKKFLIRNKINNTEGVIQYEKTGRNSWQETIISGNIPVEDFYNKKGKPLVWNGSPTISHTFVGPKMADYLPKRVDYITVKEI